MKSFLIFIIIAMISVPATAATIISYDTEKSGKDELLAINSSQIYLARYYEDDQILKVWVGTGSVNLDFEFKVQTIEKAMEILKKIYDQNDPSLIELVRFDRSRL